MNQNPTPQTNPTEKPRPGQQGRARIVALMLACLAAGLAGGAFLTSQFEFRHGQQTLSGQAPALSAPTTTALQHLGVPLEIRFYSSLDAATVPPSTPAFVKRVEQLLSRFEQEAGGKLKVVRRDFQPNSGSEKAALGDGIKPFNIEKGDACFLGIAVVGKEHKESLERLDPEWEQALEFDLARAIARAAQAERQPEPILVTPRSGPPPIEEVKRVIPDLEAVSLEEGIRLLRKAAVDEFTRAAQEMQTRIQQARLNLLEAQTNHSEAEQQAAMKQLEQLQAEQTDKLQQLAARSQAQVQALKRLKGASR
jgi:Sec-independent protein translocase protein TatA